MPKITIDHQSSLAATESLTKIKNFFETDKDLERMGGPIECQFDEASLKGKVKGKQFKADVQVETQGSGSQINVIIDLPLLLSPFKAKVEEIVKHKLAKYLA